MIISRYFSLLGSNDIDKYIPVVVIEELEEVDKILPALKTNGINCAEITFRTACANDAVKLACENIPI